MDLPHKRAGLAVGVFAAPFGLVGLWCADQTDALSIACSLLWAGIAAFCVASLPRDGPVDRDADDDS